MLTNERGCNESQAQQVQQLEATKDDGPAGVAPKVCEQRPKAVEQLCRQQLLLIKLWPGGRLLIAGNSVLTAAADAADAGAGAGAGAAARTAKALVLWQEQDVI